MFEFRKEQVQAFAADQRRKWEDAVMAHLCRVCPEEAVGLTDEELRSRVQQFAAKAEGYGIQAAETVASFVQILFEEGEDFDVHPPDPWVAQILADPQRDEYEKVDHLWAYLDGYEQEDLDDDDLEDPEADAGDDEPFEDDLEDEEDDDDDELEDGEVLDEVDDSDADEKFAE